MSLTSTQMSLKFSEIKKKKTKVSCRILEKLKKRETTIQIKGHSEVLANTLTFVRQIIKSS